MYHFLLRKIQQSSYLDGFTLPTLVCWYDSQKFKYFKFKTPGFINLSCFAVKMSYNFRCTKMLIGKQKDEEFVQIILEPSILKHLGNYFAFPNVPICLLLTNVEALSCSHVFCSCLLKNPENVSGFNLVSNCWKFPNSVPRHKGPQSLKPCVGDYFFFWGGMIFQCKQVTFYFVLFCFVLHHKIIFFYPLKYDSLRRIEWP